MKGYIIFIYFVVATIFDLTHCKSIKTLIESEYQLVQISNSSLFFVQITEIPCEDIEVYFSYKNLIARFEEATFIKLVEYKNTTYQTLSVKLPDFLSILEGYNSTYLNNVTKFETLKTTIKCTNKQYFFNSNNINRQNPYIIFSNEKQSYKPSKEIKNYIDITSQYSSMIDFNRAGLFNLLYLSNKVFYNFGKDEIYTENGKSSLIIERIMKLYSYWKYTMYHEKLRVCAKNYNTNFKDNHYYFFDIERVKGRVENPKDPYVTVIIVYYKGKSLKDCSDENEKWKFYSDSEDNPHQVFNKNKSSWVKLPLEDLIRASVLYALKFPNYLLLSHNCQHFATGMFNYITKQKSKVTNWYFTLDYDKVNKEFEDFFQCRITSSNLR